MLVSFAFSPSFEGVGTYFTIYSPYGYDKEIKPKDIIYEKMVINQKHAKVLNLYEMHPGYVKRRTSY